MSYISIQADFKKELSNDHISICLLRLLTPLELVSFHFRKEIYWALPFPKNMRSECHISTRVPNVNYLRDFKFLLKIRTSEMEEAGKIGSNSDVIDELPEHPQDLAQVPDGASRTQARIQVPSLFTQCPCQHLPLTSYHPILDLSNQ